MGFDDPIEGYPPDPAENQPPRIETWQPSESLVYLRVGEQREFRVLSVHDPDGDGFGYRWELDGNMMSNGNFYTVAGIGAGLHTLTVTVWDCPDADDFESLRQCQFDPPDNAGKDFRSWTILVEP